MDKIDLSKVDNRYQPKKIRSKSGWIGVQCHQNGYRGYVNAKGKKHFTRVFKTPEEAAGLRDKWAKAAYGELAVLNF